MISKHFIIATAGHVDHGKSSLVKALTGTDPDRLPEEKSRGITIDLGFAHLDIPDPAFPSNMFRLGIVDVPGHEDFVKNMVAGVGAIDLALLVVAADDGWMPQTEEHLQILDYLRVTRGIVALTKIDLATRPEEELLSDIQSRLQPSSLADAPVIAVSVASGRGIEALTARIAALLSELSVPPDSAKPRLAVDRAFSLQGIGTVVTGSLTGGAFARGQSVMIQPWGGKTRIRAIQSHGKPADQAVPGTRTALNIPDVPLADPPAKGVQRGDVITVEELGPAAEAIEVLIEKSPRLSGEKGGARPIKDAARLRWHHGSANIAARVRLYEPGPLLAGEQRFAQLRFEAPAFVLAGERFILRDWAGQYTLGGGIVLEAQPRPASVSLAEHLAFLQKIAPSPRPALMLEAVLTRDHVLRESEALRQTIFSPAAIRAAITEAVQNRAAILANGLILSAAWWGDLRARAAALIQEAHRKNPEKPGLPLNDLRQQFAALDQPVFDALLAHLGSEGFTQAGPVIRQTAHHPSLPPRLQEAGRRLQSALTARPLDPPSRKKLAPDPLSQQALRYFIETGQAVELGPDAVLLSENYQRAIQIVSEFIARSGPATVSQLRQALGSSRRIAVPLLERLDREGITRRQGDARLLRSP